MPLILCPNVNLQKNPLLAAELARVENHQRINAIDTTRFSLPPPPNPETATVEDWEAALKNARAQLEHQRLRCVSLQPFRVFAKYLSMARRNTNGTLLQQYGANAWKVHNYRLEMVGKHVERVIEEMNEQIAEVNRSRKNSQVRRILSTFQGHHIDTNHSLPLDENSLRSNKSGLNSFRVSCK